MSEEEDQSTEDFLKEIEEYQYHGKIREDTDDEDGSTSNNDDETKTELDNMKQYIEDLKEEIEEEKAKVKNLNEVVNKQKQIIETLQRKSEGNTSKVKSRIKCRYWNRGFCKEGDNCTFYHHEEDCESFLENGNCEDRRCIKRHRKFCRYFREEEGCYRNDICQYLHLEPKKNKEGRQEKAKGNTEKPTKTNKTFYCEQCDFKCGKEATLRKHANTKHEIWSSNTTVSHFIFRLALEDWIEEYKTYFYKYGFNSKEANHVESMIKTHGAEYIVDHIK